MKEVKFVLTFVLLFISCGSIAEKDLSSGGAAPGKWLTRVAVGFEVNGEKEQGEVDIYIPRGCSSGAAVRTILLLHGWKQHPSDWEKRTPVAEMADAYGFALACPSMGSTLYESSYYPETTNKWSAMPGGRYIVEVLIPFLRDKFRLAEERELTGVFGISTGARGAILLASLHVSMFGAAAGLSGDYDSLSMKNDRLLTSVYGPFDRHASRWEEEADIMRLAKNLKDTPVFLGHGERDAVVPCAQTKMLAEKLKELHDREGGYELVFDREKGVKAGHDWTYWAGMVPEVMGFFDRSLKKRPN
jgi:putative tributyrin esterase